MTEKASSDVKKPEEKEAEVSALELLEEDDEFEEFEGTTWQEIEREEDDTKQLWQDDWDDDDANDDFTKQLREQIEIASKET